METQQPQTPAPRKPVLLYIVGGGIVLLLAVAMFVAARYMNAGVSNLLDDGGHSLKMAAELPQTEPQTTGVFLERKDNSVFVHPASSIRIRVPQPGETGEPVMDADYIGGKVEVVISNDTLIYRDITLFDPESPERVIQQIVELSTIDELTPQSSITVWGRKAGDRIIADVIIFMSPFVFQKGAP